jgi:hypothetical protein
MPVEIERIRAGRPASSTSLKVAKCEHDLVQVLNTHSTNTSVQNAPAPSMSRPGRRAAFSHGIEREGEFPSLAQGLSARQDFSGITYSAR